MNVARGEARAINRYLQIPITAKYPRAVYALLRACSIEDAIVQ